MPLGNECLEISDGGSVPFIFPFALFPAFTHGEGILAAAGGIGGPEALRGGSTVATVVVVVGGGGGGGTGGAVACGGGVVGGTSAVVPGVALETVLDRGTTD